LKTFLPGIQRIFEEEDPLGVSLKKGIEYDTRASSLSHAPGWESPLPATEGLRLAVEHLVQGNLAQEAGVSSGNAAVYEFLQVLKWEMQAATSSSSVTE
jgi:hypothetical protein